MKFLLNDSGGCSRLNLKANMAPVLMTWLVTTFWRGRVKVGSTWVNEDDVQIGRVCLTEHGPRAGGSLYLG